VIFRSVWEKSRKLGNATLMIRNAEDDP
jgi:hypothetical protein